MKRSEVLIALGLAIALAMWAAAPASAASFAGQAPSASAGDSQSVTGCIKKGHEAGGFYLVAEDGKTYELSGDAKLSDHVGHKVTVTGTMAQAGKEKEEQIGKSEKKESGGKTHSDLQVTDVKMVSESCK